MVSQGGNWHTATLSLTGLTQDEQNAMRRVSAGSDIDLSTWQDVTGRAGLNGAEAAERSPKKGKAALSLAR